jgi:hypothetical protein
MQFAPARAPLEIHAPTTKLDRAVNETVFLVKPLDEFGSRRCNLIWTVKNPFLHANEAFCLTCVQHVVKQSDILLMHESKWDQRQKKSRQHRARNVAGTADQVHTSALSEQPTAAVLTLRSFIAASMARRLNSTHERRQRRG